MAGRVKNGAGQTALAELQEFATFPKGTQRFIRRALDVRFRSHDATGLWSRDADEAAAIDAQVASYRRLDAIKAAIPDDHDLEAMEPMMAALIAVTAADLCEGRIGSYAAFRFLYERLLGAAIRPWLPAAFCAAATLPRLHPDDRRALLRTMNDGAATAAGWSIREPAFLPTWVDKIDFIAA